MEHKGLRVTPQELKRQISRKSIREVLNQHYGLRNHTVLDQYYVHYSLVKTEDLVTMLQRITFSREFTYDIRQTDSEQRERFRYLTEIKNYVGTFTSIIEFDEIKEMQRDEQFIADIGKVEAKLRAELSEREHVPNKIDKKIIRRLKAQGKYVID